MGFSEKDVNQIHGCIIDQFSEKDIFKDYILEDLAKQINQDFLLNIDFGIYYTDRKAKLAASVNCRTNLIKVYKRCFQIPESRDYTYVNGRKCYSVIECLISVIEHEFVHIIEYRTYGRTGHGKNFKRIAWELFKQSEAHHCLSYDGTAIEERREKRIRNIANLNEAKQKFYKGEEVFFTYKSVPFRGTIIRKSKIRAKIIVSHSDGDRIFMMPYTMINKGEK